MELFVQATVFNGALWGKAVSLNGYDFDGDKWEGIYLVKKVDFDHIVIVDNKGEDFRLHMENFGPNNLTLTLLEEK